MEANVHKLIEKVEVGNEDASYETETEDVEPPPRAQPYGAILP